MKVEKMAVKINKQLKKVWVGYENGWNQGVAHIATINNIDYAIMLQSDSEETVFISFYHLKSGKLISNYPLSLSQLLKADTKEAALNLFKKIALEIEPIFKKNRKTIIEESEKHKLAMEKEFGPMPEIEDSHALDFYEG